MHGNGLMYVIERRFILFSSLWPITFAITHWLMPRRFYKQCQRARCAETHGEMRRRLTSGLIHCVFSMTVFVRSCIDSYMRFSLHELFSCAIAGVSTSGKPQARFFIPNQYLYFLYQNICYSVWWFRPIFNSPSTQGMCRYTGIKQYQKYSLNVIWGRGFTN